MWVVWNLNQIFRPTQREQSSSLHFNYIFFFKRKKQDGKPTLLGLASLIYSTNQLKISFSSAVYTFVISFLYGFKVAKSLIEKTLFLLCFANFHSTSTKKRRAFSLSAHNYLFRIVRRTVSCYSREDATW